MIKFGLLLQYLIDEGLCKLSVHPGLIESRLGSLPAPSYNIETEEGWMMYLLNECKAADLLTLNCSSYEAVFLYNKDQEVH